MSRARGLLFLLLILGGLSLAPAPAQSEQDQTSSSSTSEEGNGKSVNLWQPNDSIGLYTLILTAFTGVLAVSTIFLWFETWRGGRLARKEFIASHRAKIRVISLRPEDNKDRPIALLLTYVNVGDIDARVEQFSYRFITVGRRHEGKIAPMSDHRIALTLKSGVPENALIVSSNQGDVVAYVAVKAADFAVEFQCVGYVQYTDAGGAQRRTGYCFAMTENGAWEARPNSDYAYEY